MSLVDKFKADIANPPVDRSLMYRPHTCPRCGTRGFLRCNGQDICGTCGIAWCLAMAKAIYGKQCD